MRGIGFWGMGICGSACEPVCFRYSPQGASVSMLNNEGLR